MVKKPNIQPVSVSILGKDYRIACQENEQETLIESAHELDEQMRQIRDSGSVIGADKIAVMAALNLTHELRQAQGKGVRPKGNFDNQLANLRHKIENVLENI